MPNLVKTAALVTEVIGDTKTLFELQIKLLRAEIQDLSHFSKQFVLLGALSLAALVPAIFFLGLALSDGLASLAEIPKWASHLIIFLILAGTSVVPLLRANSLLKARKTENP